MIAKKDEPTPAPDKRKIIFCNANAITYLKPSDPFPRGEWKGQRVCEYFPGLTQYRKYLFHLELARNLWISETYC